FLPRFHRWKGNLVVGSMRRALMYARREDAMRIGLLGAGRIGRIHGGNIAAHPRASLAAVADADAAAAQRLAMAGNATNGSVDSIIEAPDIDAVVICTPTDTHADLIERAVRAGKAVFCEKPVDLNATRIRACLD